MYGWSGNVYYFICMEQFARIVIFPFKKNKIKIADKLFMPFQFKLLDKIMGNAVKPYLTFVSYARVHIHSPRQTHFVIV